MSRRDGTCLKYKIKAYTRYGTDISEISSPCNMGMIKIFDGN